VWLTLRIIACQVAARFNALFAERAPIIKAEVRDVLAELRGRQAHFREHVAQLQAANAERAKRGEAQMISMIGVQQRSDKQVKAMHAHWGSGTLLTKIKSDVGN
jgi:hypothetical protein